MRVASLALWAMVAGCKRDGGEVPAPEAGSQPVLASPSAERSVPMPANASGMVHIAAGSFFMEDSERERGVEVVVHSRERVAVAAFDLDATEVTAGAYMACVAANACAAPRASDRDDPLCPAGRPSQELKPMACVDWTEAAAYCKAQGKRLPTEVEWEYAARGGAASTSFPWGDDAPGNQLCWYGREKRGESCRVASFPAEALGTYDLAGNVEEWTATVEAPRPTDPPVARPAADYRVVRGGSWGTNAARGILLHTVEKTSFHDGGTGFRCARDR